MPVSVDASNALNTAATTPFSCMTNSLSIRSVASQTTHRGFDTVAYVIEGQFQYEDFAGHRGTIGLGDLQWMFAGRGLVHSEMPMKSQTRACGLQL